MFSILAAEQFPDASGGKIVRNCAEKKGQNDAASFSGYCAAIAVPKMGRSLSGILSLD